MQCSLGVLIAKASCIAFAGFLRLMFSNKSWAVFDVTSQNAHTRSVVLALTASMQLPEIN
jgi:hypothetical protein